MAKGEEDEDDGKESLPEPGLAWSGGRRRSALRWVLKRGGCEPEEMGLGFALLLFNQEDGLVRATKMAG